MSEEKKQNELNLAKGPLTESEKDTLIAHLVDTVIKFTGSPRFHSKKMKSFMSKISYDLCQRWVDTGHNL